MGKQQCKRQPKAGGERARRIALAQAGEYEIASAVEPRGVREDYYDERQHREPRLRMEQRLTATHRRQRERQEQRDENQPDIAREQQEAEIEREQKPIAALAVANRAPVMQQR